MSTRTVLWAGWGGARQRTTQDRVSECVDHLHEHVTDRVRLRANRWPPPIAPGLSARTHPASTAGHRYLDGPVWSTQP